MLLGQNTQEITDDMANEDHTMSEYYYQKELRLPEVTSFNELFASHREGYKVGRRCWKPKTVVAGAKPNERNIIGEYCLFQDPHRSMHVQPTKTVIELIRRDCVVHDAGPIFFKIIHHNDGKSLVVWSYNSILGGRGLARIDTDTIPESE